jgi:copper chaperone CopZ
MKYQIQVKGMHCHGCKNLITMSLEELGYKEVSLNYENGQATFAATEPIEKIENDLDKMFSQFESYSYTNLTKVA